MTNKRRRLSWSQDDLDLIERNLAVEGGETRALITRLVEQSGNPRWACWRLVRRMGVRCKRPQRLWTLGEQQRLIKFIDLYPIPEIARLMRRSISSIWHMLYRLGANAKMGKDSFTKHSLAVALHVRPETVQTWIDRGLLKTQEIQLGSIKRAIIEAEDFCEFCRLHTKDVIGNRLNKERLDFVYRFVFPPSHAELLPVRQSIKERKAYEEQECEKTKKPPRSSEANQEDRRREATEQSA